jgi:uncharacterized protein (TIGR03067 family)
MTHRLLIACLGMLLTLTPAIRLSADEKDDAVKATMKLLAGEWETESIIRDGKKLPAPPDGQPRFTIREGKFTVTVGDKTSYSGSFVIDPTKKPITIDTKYVLPDGKEIKFLGIIEIKEREYKGCWADPGKDRPTSFTAEKNSGQMLGIYKRIK